MFAVIKFFLAFCISFVLLSIPIQKKPIFHYLNQWARPITQEIFDSSKTVLLDSVKETKTIGKKMFNNTTPKQDRISTKSSSVHKRPRVELEALGHHDDLSNEVEDIKHQDDYTDEEKSMLNQILNQKR